jgi:hypothetical protein
VTRKVPYVETSSQKREIVAAAAVVVVDVLLLLKIRPQVCWKDGLEHQNSWWKAKDNWRGWSNPPGHCVQG